MQMLMMLGLAMAAPVEPVTHDVVVEHQGIPLNVTYRADIDMSAKTVRMVLPSRVKMEQCRWTADVTVERPVARTGARPALTRTLGGRQTHRGRRHGHCTTPVAPPPT